VVTPAAATRRDFGTSRLATPIEPYTFFGSLWKRAAIFPVMAFLRGRHILVRSWP
jgi:hypothetical protein